MPPTFGMALPTSIKAIRTIAPYPGDSNLRQVVIKTNCHTGRSAAHQNPNVADTAFYWEKMPSRTFLAGGEKQCLVLKRQMTGYLVGTVLDHCHCVKMPDRNQRTVCVWLIVDWFHPECQGVA